MGWPVTIGQILRLLRSEEESGEYLQALLEDWGRRGSRSLPSASAAS